MNDDDVRLVFRRPLVVDRSRASVLRPALSSESSEPRPAPTPVSGSRRADALTVMADLQRRLIDELGERDVFGDGAGAIRAEVRAFVERVATSEDLPLNDTERERLSDDLAEEVLGVGPLASLVADPSITDILVNGPDQVWVERYGRLERSAVRFRDHEHVQRIIERLAMRVGRRIDQSWPMVDMRLSDGSRVNATIPPASIDGPTLSIRRFGRRRMRQDDLLRGGCLSREMLDFLRAAVRFRLNIVISGGTGAGKSTLLGALCESIPTGERILTIEDTAELVLDQEHVVRLETRPANVEGQGRITARDLVVNALRMRPSRIIMGEVRSGEALDMLQAMNTGHEGGLTTVHANSSRDALARLETMVLMAGADLPSRSIREQIVAALHLVVHVERQRDGMRRITSICEIAGMEGSTPQVQDVFRWERRDGGSAGFLPTGIVPRVFEELRLRGSDLRIDCFRTSGGTL